MGIYNAPVPPPQAHWTVTQVARRWGKKPKTVYGMIRDGTLPAIRLGPKTIRISQAALDDFEAAHTTTPAQARRDLLGADAIAFAHELASAAASLTEEQKDIVRAAVRAPLQPPAPDPGPLRGTRPVPRPKRNAS